MFLWAWLKRQKYLSTIDVGDIGAKVKSVFDLENSALGDWVVRRGERGKQFPGSRITMWRTLLGDEILTLQNDFEIKVRSTSAQPDEHVVFWISTGGGWVSQSQMRLEPDCSVWINLFLRVRFLAHEHHKVQVQINKY